MKDKSIVVASGSLDDVNTCVTKLINDGSKILSVCYDGTFALIVYTPKTAHPYIKAAIRGITAGCAVAVIVRWIAWYLSVSLFRA